MQKDLSLIKKQIKEILLLNPPTKDKNANFKILADIARLRLGRIKEGELYITAKTKMTFIDKFDNEFQMVPSNVKSGGWSPYESKTVRDPDYHMKELAKIAKERGGRIKEGEVYVNSETKITFIDKLGNEFKMVPGSVKQGYWSQYESRNVRNNPDYHLKDLEQIAKGRGGKIKEGEVYVNPVTKIAFIDKLGNEFKMSSNNVKRGGWSPYESGNVRDSDYHMKLLEKFATEKGGKIKEGEYYINKDTKMTFVDQLGNEFKITPGGIKKGGWSPYEKNYSEHICRQIIEEIYNQKFPSVWNIIKRENGNKLQLDGYCKKLNIAFEYQGVQHKVGWNNKDKKNQEKSLIEITKRDNEKKQACKDLKILLLEVNYYKKINNMDDIITQTIVDIKKSYEANNIDIPFFIDNLNISEIKIDLSKISHLVLMQKELEKIVSLKEGKIKEGEQYINSYTKMIFVDKFDNEFKMTPSSVKSGHWSPYESGTVRDSDYHMKALEKIATQKSGKIKEGEIYVNDRTKMTFIDQLGNEFKMIPSDIKQGNWSPYESGTVRDSYYHMKALEKIATEKGGKIKEGEIYINTKTKIIFIDKLGNEFKMIPNAVKRGQWSPYESGNVYNDSDYHMKKLEEILAFKGRKIKEGEVYINNQTKMTFINQFGNEFENTPANIKSNHRRKVK